jgi:hypothetical protein
MAEDWIGALSGNEFSDWLIDEFHKLRTLIGVNFFSLSEEIWESVGSICLNLTLLGILLIGGFIGLRLDSLSFVFGALCLPIGLFVMHVINRRLFRTFDQFVRGNRLIVTDLNMTNAFGVLSLGPAFGGIPVGLYFFMKFENPTFLYAGITVTLVALYVASFMLNPEILNIEASEEASIGDNGITYLSIINGIGPARLARLAYNIALLNGFLMFAHGFLEKVVSSSVVSALSMFDFSAAGLGGTGVLVVLAAVAVPLPLFLYIIIVHVFLDALSSLVRSKNVPKGSVSRLPN